MGFNEDKFVLQDKEVLEWAGGDGCIAAWVLITPLDSVTAKWLSGELYFVCTGLAKKFIRIPPKGVALIAYRKPCMNICIGQPSILPQLKKKRTKQPALPLRPSLWLAGPSSVAHPHTPPPKLASRQLRPWAWHGELQS